MNKIALFAILFFTLSIVGILFKNFILMFLGLASLFIMFSYASSEVKKDKDNSKEKFTTILKQNNFNPDKKILATNLLIGLAINEDSKKIAYISRKDINDDFSLKLFSFEDLIEAKVITNNQTLTSTSIGSVVARGIVGGLIAGGIGSIIGGATASSTSKQEIKELTLELVVDDVLNPRYTIPFYKSELPIKESNLIILDIENWYRTFSVIINRNKQVRSV